MKRITFLIIILLSLGCSKNIDYENLNEIDISISSDHKILSSSDLIKETFLNFLNEQVIDFSSVSKDLYKTTWVYAFQAKRKWPNRYNIRVKEHQPLAKWGDNKFLTHSGILIKPSIDDSNIHLVLLRGTESDKFILLDISRQIQNQLNRYNEKVEEVNLSSGGYLKVTTEKGTELTFTTKNFREQLERLEDFISFELFSGKLNSIRNMDFRYNNGVSILFY